MRRERVGGDGERAVRIEELRMIIERASTAGGGGGGGCVAGAVVRGEEGRQGVESAPADLLDVAVLNARGEVMAWKVGVST